MNPAQPFELPLAQGREPIQMAPEGGCRRLLASTAAS
jgi:hypothetical protein